MSFTSHGHHHLTPRLIQSPFHSSVKIWWEADQPSPSPSTQESINYWNSTWPTASSEERMNRTRGRGMVGHYPAGWLAVHPREWCQCPWPWRGRESFEGRSLKPAPSSSCHTWITSGRGTILPHSHYKPNACIPRCPSLVLQTLLCPASMLLPACANSLRFKCCWLVSFQSCSPSPPHCLCH